MLNLLLITLKTYIFIFYFYSFSWQLLCLVTCLVKKIFLVFSIVSNTKAEFSHETFQKKSKDYRKVMRLIHTRFIFCANGWAWYRKWLLSYSSIFLFLTPLYCLVFLYACTCTSFLKLSLFPSLSFICPQVHLSSQQRPHSTLSNTPRASWSAGWEAAPHLIRL